MFVQNKALQTTFASSERLYLTKEGEVVGADDSRRVELLVKAGGTLPAARAVELGLVEPVAVVDELNSNDAEARKIVGERAKIAAEKKLAKNAVADSAALDAAATGGTVSA